MPIIRDPATQSPTSPTVHGAEARVADAVAPGTGAVAPATGAVAPATDEAAPIADAVAAPSGWSDPMTGTDGPRLWDRLISAESARIRRYKRPATVALVEIEGLDRVAAHWGLDVAELTLHLAARALAREIRSSDHIARIGPCRFGILLTETSEIAAINFVERARAACESELRVAAEVGVGFGWASPPHKRGLADAVLVAEGRLLAELASLAELRSAADS